jgi:hypothetical protein
LVQIQAAAPNTNKENDAMAYNVICLQTGALVRTNDGFGTVISWAVGAVASGVASQLTDSTGKKHQVRKEDFVDNGAWKQRELDRYNDGAYQQVPWHLEAWWREATCNNLHYCHVSTKEPGKIAYTENVEKGIADIQTQMSPGRYLTKYFADVLTSATITEYARAFAAEYDPSEVKFAKTETAIEWVYVNGPPSCMSSTAKHYRSHCHPVRAYAAGDLAIAYIENGNGRVASRAVCWPDKKLYTRIYGDARRLEKGLDILGYSFGSLVGAKMKRIVSEDDSGVFVVPYVDHVGRASDNGAYLTIGGSKARVDCSLVNGLSEENENQASCQHCGEDADEEDLIYFEEVEEQWCADCIDNNTSVCNRCEERTRDTNIVAMANGDGWCSNCFEDHGFTCDGNGQNYPLDDMVTMADGANWSPAWFQRNGHECGECGENYDNDEPCDCDKSEELPAHVARQGIDPSPAQPALDLAMEKVADSAHTYAQELCAIPTNLVSLDAAILPGTEQNPPVSFPEAQTETAPTPDVIEEIVL